MLHSILCPPVAGHARVVIVDGFRPRMPQARVNSPHDLSLSAALALGRALDMRLPSDEAIVIIAIEADDVLTFGETCTPWVQAAISQAVQMVVEVLKC